MLQSEVCYQGYSSSGEISNFLQPSLAQSSKKLHAPWLTSSHFTRATRPQWAGTIVPQYNLGELCFPMHSWLYPHTPPHHWSAHHFSCLNITNTGHIKPVHQPRFSPRPPSIDEVRRRNKADSLDSGLSPCLPLTKTCLCSLSRSTARAIQTWATETSWRAWLCLHPRTRDSTFRLCRKKHLTVWLIFCVPLWSALQSPGPWPRTACCLPFQHYRTGCSLTTCPPTIN